MTYPLFPRQNVSSRNPANCSQAPEGESSYRCFESSHHPQCSHKDDSIGARFMHFALVVTHSPGRVIMDLPSVSVGISCLLLSYCRCVIAGSLIHMQQFPGSRFGSETTEIWPWYFRNNSGINMWIFCSMPWWCKGKWRWISTHYRPRKWVLCFTLRSLLILNVLWTQWRQRETFWSLVGIRHWKSNNMTGCRGSNAEIVP